MKLLPKTVSSPSWAGEFQIVSIREGNWIVTTDGYRLHAQCTNNEPTSFLGSDYVEKLLSTKDLPYDIDIGLQITALKVMRPRQHDRVDLLSGKFLPMSKLSSETFIPSAQHPRICKAAKEDLPRARSRGIRHCKLNARYLLDAVKFTGSNVILGKFKYDFDPVYLKSEDGSKIAIIMQVRS